MTVWAGDLDSKIDVIDTSIDTLSAIIGDKSSIVEVPYSEGATELMGFLHTGYYHVHGASFVYPKYATPIQLTSNAAAWNTTGAIVEIIPADTIIKPFDLHWCSISEISADLFGIIDIFAGDVGSEVLIGAVDVSRTTAQSRENAAPVQVPQQAANTRISARFSDSTALARTVRVKFYGHVYGTSLI